MALVAAGLGLAFRLRTAALPAETLSSRYLADDYFYYLNVAHHLAHGHGSSFDGGLTTTNGYQPLLLWLLAALFALGLSKIAVLHAGLVIQAAAGAAASLIGYRMLAERGAPWAGAGMAALWSLNLFFVLPSLTGFEMALALATLMAAAWCWQRGHPPFIVGLLCGVAALARVDSLALTFAFAVLLGLGVRQETIATSRLRSLAGLVAGLSIVAGPWLLWNWVAFDSPMPDSGVIKAHYRGAGSALHALASAAMTLPRAVLPGRIADPLIAEWPWVAAMFSTLMVAGVIRGAAIETLRPLAIAALGLLTVYVLLIGAGEPGALVRYLYPVWAIAIVLIAAAVHRWSPNTAAGAAVALFVLHAADLALYVRWEHTAPVQLTYVGASHTLAPAVIDALPPVDRIAAFDAGALGYFASRPVVNLDGLANHDIVALRRACRSQYPDCLKDYLRSKGISMLAGGTGFGWISLFPDWATWVRVYESPPLVDGSRLVMVRLP